MSYTISPVHTEDYFVKLAAQIAEMGADIICIKDMANLLLPYAANHLIKRLKAETGLPIVLRATACSSPSNPVQARSMAQLVSSGGVKAAVDREQKRVKC